jgi:hypothetical protein
MNNKHITKALMVSELKENCGHWISHLMNRYTFTDASKNFTYGIKGANMYHDTDTRKGV